MSYDYSEICSYLNEHSEIPSFLREPVSGRSGCKEPSTKSKMSSKYDPDHYHAAVEPWDLVAAHNLDFFSGNVIKYVVRAGKKAGESDLDDLIKAQIYLKKLIEIRSAS